MFCPMGFSGAVDPERTLATRVADLGPDAATARNAFHAFLFRAWCAFLPAGAFQSHAAYKKHSALPTRSVRVFAEGMVETALNA